MKRNLSTWGIVPIVVFKFDWYCFKVNKRAQKEGTNKKKQGLHRTRQNTFLLFQVGLGSLALAGVS